MLFSKASKQIVDDNHGFDFTQHSSLGGAFERILFLV